jgi:hypothetical protein
VGALVEQVLAPTLSAQDVVIMDNLRRHKVAGVREAIEAKGASVLYLPAYSPDLNPIEQVFAKLKAQLRKAAARSVTKLWNAVCSMIGRFAAEECANYLAHAAIDGHPETALADSFSLTMRMEPLRWSPVRSLYLRHGFADVGQSDIHIFMKRPAAVL